MSMNMNEYMLKRRISLHPTQSLSRNSFVNFRVKSLTIDKMDNEMQVGTGMDFEVYEETPDFKFDFMMEWQNMIVDETKEQEFGGDWIDSDDENYKSDDNNIIEQVVNNNINEIYIVDNLEENNSHKQYIETVVDDIMQNAVLSEPIYQALQSPAPSIVLQQSVENDMKVDYAIVKQNEQSAKQDIIVARNVAKKLAKKRQFIEEEIFQTEEAYCKNLNTLLNEFIEPIFNNGFVDKKYYNAIRCSLPQILQFHQIFLNKLRDAKSKNNNKTLANVFNVCFVENKEKFIDIYMEFIKNYDMILDLFGTTFHDNLQLKQFLKAKRRERKPLSGFLILPVQRVPRYILLLTDLRTNCQEWSADYDAINGAVKIVEDITAEINERKKQIENLSQCLQIQEALNGLKEPIVNENRRFVEEFIFIKKKLKHQRLFFLFNDIVIVANEKWSVKNIFDIRTLEVKIKDNDIQLEVTPQMIRKSLVLSSNARKSMVDLTSDAVKAYKMENKLQLPEFELVSASVGKEIYVAKDIESINMFKKLIGKWRLETMTSDLAYTCIERNETLGSLKDQLNKQALLYNDDFEFK